MLTVLVDGAESWFAPALLLLCWWMTAVALLVDDWTCLHHLPSCLDHLPSTPSSPVTARDWYLRSSVAGLRLQLRAVLTVS